MLAPNEESVVNRALTDLRRLSPAARLEAISRLVESVKAEAVTPDTRKSLLDFAGAWNDIPDSAEELMAEIRASRTFTRPEISLD